MIKTISESERENKDRYLFDRIAEEYCQKDIHESSMLARRHRLRKTFRILPEKRYSRILEIGCGGGFAAKYLEGYYHQYIGIDYSDKLIAYAKEFHSSSNSDFRVANIKDYKDPEPFDIIFMIGVLHHIDGVENSMKQIVNMLKPGGWFIANEPQPANRIIQGVRKLRAKMDSKYSSDQITFSRHQLHTLFKNTGLQNIRVIPQGIFSTPFAEVTIKPEFISIPFVKLAILTDSVLERIFSKIVERISWNIIAVGQAPM